MNRIPTRIGGQSCDIHVGPGLLDDPALLAGCVGGHQVLVVSDRNVAPHYLPRLKSALADRRLDSIVLPPGEQEKNLWRFAELLSRLAALGAHRDATVVALGGGVVGDLAGFAAACWMRGVQLVQVPTSLLAMVDASVGGKTAVDLPEGKNLVGAFHVPACVIADTRCLATLPDRELRAGLAEVVKYGAINDPGFFAWIEEHAAALLARDEAALSGAIRRSVAAKAALVAEDPRESGVRVLLNFGHSFAHAIESEQDYLGLVHGEAVAVGMRLAASLSERLGMAPGADTGRLRRLLDRLGLPTALPEGLDADALLARMQLDKKNRDGRLRLVLWRGVGRAEAITGVSATEVGAVLRG